jgi:hypothetical protein
LEVNSPGAQPPEAGPARAGSRSLAEIVFATTLVVVALAVIATASGYPRESATYPIVIGVGIAVLGLWIGLREILKRRRADALPGTFAENGPRLIIGLAALVIYFAAVSLIGFILPSLALGVLLPAAVGFRGWSLSATVAAISVLTILLIFVLALERPIPPDILSPVQEWLR